MHPCVPIFATAQNDSTRLVKPTPVLWICAHSVPTPWYPEIWPPFITIEPGHAIEWVRGSDVLDLQVRTPTHPPCPFLTPPPRIPPTFPPLLLTQAHMLQLWRTAQWHSSTTPPIEMHWCVVVVVFSFTLLLFSSARTSNQASKANHPIHTPPFFSPPSIQPHLLSHTPPHAIFQPRFLH